MNAAEKMFRTYFASISEYKAFCAKYKVVTRNTDYAGRTGCRLDVVAPDGFVMSFEDKPATISFGRYSYRNYDYLVSWYGRDALKVSSVNQSGVVRHRPEVFGPAYICMHGGLGFETQDIAKMLHEQWFESDQLIRENRAVFSRFDIPKAKRKRRNALSERVPT